MDSNWFQRSMDSWVNLDTVSEIRFTWETEPGDHKNDPPRRVMIARLDTGETPDGLEVRAPYSVRLHELMYAQQQEPAVTIGVAEGVPKTNAFAAMLENVTVDDILIEKPEKGGKQVVLIDFTDEDNLSRTARLIVSAYKFTPTGNRKDA